jgi:tRNA-dihydrouridine synthase B
MSHQPDESGTRIYLAPLRGVTTRVYRTAFHRSFGGVDVALAPFALVPAGADVSARDLADVDPARGQAMSVIPQLIGSAPERLATACRMLAAQGHAEVNLNLGCPYPFVVRKRRGAGLLAMPDAIRAALDAIFAAVDVAISIKTRLGLDERGQLLALADLFNGYPLKEITIHPRTARQMYDGPLDLEMFERCADALAAPVVFNGGIRTLDEFRRTSDRLKGVSRWMIGRGLVADPCLAAAIKGLPVPADPRAAIAAFVDDLAEAYARELSGDAHLLDRMKELWKYLRASFRDGERFGQKVGRTHSLSAYRAMAVEFLSRAEWLPGR